MLEAIQCKESDVSFVIKCLELRPADSLRLVLAAEELIFAMEVLGSVFGIETSNGCRADDDCVRPS
jgi:hypothetical protein